MIYVLILILWLYFGLSFYSKKFNSPYTLTMIFGKKGSGKTTIMTKMMVKDLKKGWNVYTDIEGINVPGVRFFNLHDLEVCSPPPHSAVYLDEVGLSMDNREYKSFANGLRDYLALQRHYKNKVVLASQAFDVDKKVRDRTDRFLYQTKIAGCIGISRPIIIKMQPNDQPQQGNDNPVAVHYKWGSFSDWRVTWIPRYAKYFNSFEAPYRPDVRFKEIPREIKQLRRKPWLRRKK